MGHRLRERGDKMSRMSGLVIDQIKHRRIVSRTGCFTWEEEGKVKKRAR